MIILVIMGRSQDGDWRYIKAESLPAPDQTGPTLPANYSLETGINPFSDPS